MNTVEQTAGRGRGVARETTTGGVVGTLLVGLVGGALAWAVSLSYPLAGGNTYEVWQVVLAVVAFALVCVVARVLAAGRMLPVTVLAVALGFTAAWTVFAGARDDTGLFLVGAMILLPATLVGALVVCGITDLVLRRSATR